MWSVFFVFLSYLDRNLVLSRALDAEEESKEVFSVINGTVCAKMSAVGENFLYQVSGGAEVVRSVVSPAGRLVNCSVLASHTHVRSFAHECRLGARERGAGRLQETRFTRVDEAKLMCRQFQERSERREEDAELRGKAVRRSKRGFTYPGTLWCGAGNMADTYEQLGDFAETDSCCRTHDHCPHVIHAFSSNYGYTNFKWHSICHCDCDQALRSCLRKVNDTSSRVVGQAFFNVIGVPCFEFAFEEQCAERHWYGMCKRYEKYPIAVLKDAIPYDFGGIAVIDTLTLAPPKMTESKKSDEEEKTESKTQSTMSGPEEPSLTNVVTAAEDFIKVLATVSTSQSSTVDSDKGETQSSEKKKRKNAGKNKKNSKKRKGKGKGRKRKQKAVVKIEEGATVSPHGSKAEEVISLSNFISESHRGEQPSTNTNRAGDNEYRLGSKEEPSNEVMKDEPAMDKEMLSIKSPVTGLKDIKIDNVRLTSTVSQCTEENRRLKKKRRKKSRKIALPPSEEVVLNTAPPVMNTDKLNAIPVPTIITTTPTAQPSQQSFSTANTPVVIPKVKRNRSKERGGREGWKKRRKVSWTSPIENSSAENLEVIPLTGAPTVPSVATTQRQVPHRPDTYRWRLPAPNPSFSISKRQRSKSRGLSNRRRKTDLSLSSENSFENLLHSLRTAEMRGELKSPTTTAGSRSAERLGAHSERRLLTTAAPHTITKEYRHTVRQQRKPRQKHGVADSSDTVSTPQLTEHTTMTFTVTPPKVATTTDLNLQGSKNVKAAAIELSMERWNEQFSRKKRRKAACQITMCHLAQT